MTPAIVFDHVWKKFRRGERHDSLRDLLPAAARRLFRRPRASGLESEEFWALKDVSFEVGPGEALGIIGSNGAGKSTVLKLLTRILKPTIGTCRVNGRVGALIEIAAGFHPDLTGRENIYLQGAILGMKNVEISRRLDEIVAFSGIEDFIDTPVKRYSSGMNARLGFSIAAHVDPEVLLIDEVLAVGDFTFQQKCYERLKEFRAAGVAIVFVSHNLQAIASLCDSALLLRSGQDALLGNVPTITAAFVSSSNVAGADPRVDVLGTSLVNLDRHDRDSLTAPVSPGANLLLELRLRSVTMLTRAGILLQVVRSDGTVMYQGMSTLDGLPEEELAPGDVRRLGIRFAANLLRGVYVCNVELVDSLRMWPPVVLTGCASFVVAETTRIAGCVELSPTYEVTREIASTTSSA